MNRQQSAIRLTPSPNLVPAVSETVRDDIVVVHGSSIAPCGRWPRGLVKALDTECYHPSGLAIRAASMQAGNGRSLGLGTPGARAHGRARTRRCRSRAGGRAPRGRSPARTPSASMRAETAVKPGLRISRRTTYLTSRITYPPSALDEAVTQPNDTRTVRRIRVRVSHLDDRRFPGR